jgi:hypothetical protein
MGANNHRPLPTPTKAKGQQTTRTCMTSKRVHFPPAECDLDTHSVISTQRVYFLTLSVILTRTRLISTHTRVSLTRMRVNMTLTGVFSTRSSVISTRRAYFLHAV